MVRLFFLVALAASACADRPAPPDAAAEPAAAEDTSSPAAPALPGYDFARPSASFALPAGLTEISGLAVLPDGRLAAVQDERGVLYTLDAATGRVLSTQEFEGKGDFEGVEYAADAVWVLQSNGTLYELAADGSGAEKHNTPLKARCDAEGLAFDAAGNRLLIACKEDPGEGLGDVRAIYAFDLAARALSEQPAFVLDRAALDAGGENFKPAALAVHPRTGALYVLSSVRKAVAVVGRDGRGLEVVALPPSLYRQPEGLAFLPDGTLFLASEGAGADAMLYRFDERR